MTDWDEIPDNIQTAMLAVVGAHCVSQTRRRDINHANFWSIRLRRNHRSSCSSAVDEIPFSDKDDSQRLAADWM